MLLSIVDRPSEIDEKLILEAFENADKELSEVKEELEISDDAKINLVFVSDEQIRELNKTYRDKDSVTDVLSFGYIEKDEEFVGDDEVIGDIFIASDVAKKQAEERGVSYDEEVQFLFIHALLHIFGYVHDTSDELEIMMELTDDIVGKKFPPYPEKED